MVARRTAGLPLEHVVGWAEFCGLRITVAPGVFVPRWRTEFLVGQAVALARPGDVIADVCCGAGAIGIAVAAATERAELFAADIDRVAIVVANVPYVPTGEIGLLPPEARDHEPLTALDGGPDGLEVLRRVAAGAPGWLAPGGHLLIETSERQAPAAQAAFTAAGLTTRVASSADLGTTVIIGKNQ
jgi:release factor glutamine methyltransferase